jgi:hypothetical protein
MITDPTERDLIIRTVIGEAASEGPVGQLAVAHVIANRMRSAGRGARDIVFARNQFEPWNNPTTAARLQSIQPTDPSYQRVAQALEPFFSGQSQDPTGGATHFYSPTAQAGLGRQAPSWDNGSGHDIGRHRFFTLGYAPSASSNPHGIPFPGQQTATPASPSMPGQTGGLWDQAGALTAGIQWDDTPDPEAPAAATPAPTASPAAPAAPGAQPTREQVVDQMWQNRPQFDYSQNPPRRIDAAQPSAAPAQPALAIQWDDAPPEGATAPVPSPRPASAPLGTPDVGATFAATAPASPGALSAPNLDQTFAQFQGGLPAQGEAVAQQRSIPEITIRPRDSQTRRQQAQAEAERSLAEQNPVMRTANTIVQGVARGVNPFMDDTVAFLDTIVGRGDGATFSQRYGANLDRQRGVNAAYDAQSPILSIGSQLGGGLALPVGQLSAPANAMTRLGRGAMVGAGYGAAFGAGQGDGLADRAQRAATGAVVGGVTGGALNALVGPRLPQNAITTRPSGQAVIDAADRQGVQVPRLIATDSTAMQRVGQGVRNVPLAGDPIVRNTDRMVQQMGARMDDTAAALGGGAVPTADAAGAAARSGIEQTVRVAMPARADQLYGRVEQLVPPGQVYPIGQTSQIAQQIVSRNQAAGLGQGQAVSVIDEALQRGGLTYQGMRDLRTRLNEMTSFGNTPQGMSNAELKQIGAALTADIDAAARAAGPAAYQAHKRADQWYSAWTQRRETLGRIMNANSDEGIITQIQNAASSRASADIWKLSTARKAMQPDEWNEVASVIVSRLGRDGDGNFSPARFVTDYGKLSERGKDILFRATGNRTHAQALDDIATISSRSREVQRFGNPSGTAQNLSAAGIGAGLLASPITTMATVLGGNVVSRVLASPATASSAARWSRAYQLAIQTPTAATVSGLQIASRNFASTLGDKLGVTVDPNSLFRALPYQRFGQSEEDRNNVPAGGAAAP